MSSSLNWTIESFSHGQEWLAILRRFEVCKSNIAGASLNLSQVVDVGRLTLHSHMGKLKWEVIRLWTFYNLQSCAQELVTYQKRNHLRNA